MLDFHCATPECQSTCELSSRDRDRIIDALKERGWSAKVDYGRTRYYCPTCTDKAEAEEQKAAEAAKLKARDVEQPVSDPAGS